MTDKAPERIWVCPQYEEKAFHDFEFGGWPEYVRADILEAAQARIAELEARPTIRTHDGPVAVIRSEDTIRAEVLEEAEQAFISKSTPGERVSLLHILETIRAIKEKPNG